jgi:hypothetical protein
MVFHAQPARQVRVARRAGHGKPRRMHTHSRHAWGLLLVDLLIVCLPGQLGLCRSSGRAQGVPLPTGADRKTV